MIVFDLRCSGDHVFEAWFASSSAFEDQRKRGLVECPICADRTVAKALMAPRLASKANTRAEPPVVDPKRMLQMIASAQAEALKSSRWVGRSFADEARAMHDGERAHETIHGQATREEAEALADEGIAAMPLLVPVTAPDKLN